MDLQHGGLERRRRKPVFGMRIGDLDVAQSAQRMLSVRRSVAEGVGLFATPNIQHVALANADPEFAAALRGAQIVVADGFPVYRFARLRGLDLPGRVTGREVVEAMFADPAALVGHRGFFVVDSADSAAAIAAWAAETLPGFACETHVPPFGFDCDLAYGIGLADAIRSFDASLLFLCIGAPKSELFVHRHRALLPPCWALCVGQSFRLILGQTTPPPALMVRLNLEWLWRIALEPKRMLRRYGPSAFGFLRAAVADLRGR